MSSRVVLSMTAKRSVANENVNSKRPKPITSFLVTKSPLVADNSTVTTLSPSQSNPIETNLESFQLANLISDVLWKEKLFVQFSKSYFKKIESFLKNQYANKKIIFPPQNLIFNAFNLTSLDKIKIVILGQDPYHDDLQAHGLSFSVPKGIKMPPSLKNIFKELAANYPDNFKIPDNGSLENWAKSGVLLLNATLTVEAHKANSHADIGWQMFTDATIKIVSEHCSGVVFILWGNFAKKKEKLIDLTKHTVLKSAHPSPLSCTKFFGCKCFLEANKILAEKYCKDEVDWNLN